MTSYCSIGIGSLVKINHNTYYWYCINCKEYHQETISIGLPPYKSTITVVTEEEYNANLTYSRL